MSEKKFTQPGNQQSHFAQVPAAEIERSTFDRSHGHKTTFDASRLIPVYVDEVLPGDSFTLNSTAFCRLATPLKPVMDNLYMDTHYFYVPYRLVWDHFQEFMGERKDPSAAPVTYTVPQATINHTSLQYYTLANHFGLPYYASGTSSVSALPFRAYTLIWNEWYRDQNLQPPKQSPTDDGPDAFWSTYDCLRRGKRHDYFTSCLPWPQKGDPVYIPLGKTAPVIPNVAAPTPKVRTNADPTARNMQIKKSGDGDTIAGPQGYNLTTYDYLIWTDTGMMADLTAATAVTINDLRTAFQIQKLLERDARGGTRFREMILSHFGVTIEDSRIQRPEYLGGGTTMVNINPIASTVPDAAAPQGNLAAFGTAVGKASFSKSFTEHGVIIGLVSVRADLTYQQGIERFWSRKTRYSFYWPALAHLGEQQVYTGELYTQGTIADAVVFGYQEIYAEYRYKPSRITGKFASADPGSLDVWHLAQDFGAVPVLNAGFIEENVPIGRIIAVPSEPHFLMDMWFDLKCTRPMPVFSVPGLIDHF